MISLSDTTATDVVKALATERHSSGDTRGLALNLVVIVDEEDEHETEAALTVAAQEHPCRLLIVVRHGETARRARLDAEIIVGGRLGPCEAVVMRMSGPLAGHAESVVMPLLAPDVPVVTCWFGPPPHRAADDPLGAFADRRITYCALAAEPTQALRVRAADYNPGDTDLVWTRITRWRTLIAIAFDTARSQVRSVTIEAAARDASVALIAGWLAGKLGITPVIRDVDVASNGQHVPAIRAVSFDFENDDTIAVRRDASGNTVLHRTDFPDRSQSLQGRTLGELLAEELRQLDADTAYAQALTICTGEDSLCGARVEAS